MNRSAPLVLIAVGSILAGCSFPFGGLSIQRDGTALVRPEGTIGPGDPSGPPWQTYKVAVPASLAEAVVRTNSTFHLEVTDCRPGAGALRTDGHFDMNGWIGAEDSTWMGSR